MRKASEVRKYKRSKFVFPVRISLLNDKDHSIKDVFHVFSDNISEGGLKFEIKKNISQKSSMLLRFDLLMDDKIFQIETGAHIRWMKKKNSELFEYGVMFDTLEQNDWSIIVSFMKYYCEDL